MVEIERRDAGMDKDEKNGEGLFKSYPKEKKDESGFQVNPKGEVSKSSQPESERKWGSYKDPPDKGSKKSGFGKTAGFGPVWQGPKDSGAIYTTKKTAKDKSYASFGHYETEVSAIAGSYDFDKLEAELDVVEAKGKFSVVHATVDLIDSILKLFGFGSPPTPPIAPAPPQPYAARILDPTAHGAPLTPGPGSPNVLIGGLPAWRASVDFSMCPIVKGTVPDVGGTVVAGTPTVLINSMQACRAGDQVLEVPGGSNPILMGCSTVLVGSMTGGGGKAKPGETGGKELPPVDGELKAEGDLLSAEAQAKISGSVDLNKMEGEVVAKAGGIAAVAKGHVTGSLKLRIPFTSYYFVVGAQAEGSVLSAGAEAGAGVTINKTDPKTGKKSLFKAEAGAKAALGLGGGVKFSLGIESGE